MNTAVRAAMAASLLVTMGCVADEPAAVVNAADGDGVVVVVADDLFYENDHIEVAADRPTTIRLQNDGNIVHDLVLDDGWESGTVLPGDATTVEVGPLEAGTIGWCSIPGHRDAGMELEIRVAGEAP